MRVDVLAVIIVCAITAVICAMLTGVVRKFALSHGVLDIPNARSSHVTVTPRGGGLAIVITCTFALVALGFLDAIRLDVLMSLIGGGTAIALIGFLDDRRPIPASIRLAVHVAAGVWALLCLGGVPLLPGAAGYLVALLGIVWVLNLFNFMDGIDGIAASEAIFVTVGAAVIALLGGDAGGTAAASCAVAAACSGFLLWNWPPARIFMGDVGSGYLGYVIGVLALAATRGTPTAGRVWLILGGVFLVDATVTLMRRAWRGERILEAHRSHAYQWLSRRWGSHRRVTVGVTVLNLFWLLPCAWAAAELPRFGMWIALAALAPLVALAILAGSGKPEIR
jgi:Fuc2NAc and GlcNAc transferase